MADKAKLLKIAQKNLSKGNLDKAIKTFKQLVEVDPRDQRLILRLADILARAGRKKEAIEHYEKVAAGYIRQDFTPKAIAVYKTILRLDPELLSAYEKLAQLYKNQGLEAEALSQFENLFQIYERKNNEDKQIEVLKLMADMDPENLGFQVRLAENLARKGRKKEAAETFAKAAATLSRRGFHDRASQLFEKITSLDPDNTVVRRELCSHYLESGKFKEARSEIEAILRIEPDDPRMVLLLARILFQIGEKEEGEERLAYSIRLFLESGELDSVIREFLFVAQSYLKNGEIDEAEAFYRQITTNVPGEVKAIKGLVSVAEKRKDRAGLVENLLLLARTMQQDHDTEGAASVYRRIHEIDPLNDEAKGYLQRMPAVELSAAVGQSETIATDDEASVFDVQELQDLEEVEEVTLLDTEEMEFPGEEDGLDEGIEISYREEPEGSIPEAESQEILEAGVSDEGELPDIVMEDLDDVEDLMDISDIVEGAQEPLVADEEQIAVADGEHAEEMSLEEILAEADVYERYGLGDKLSETLERARALAPDDKAVLERIEAFESGSGQTGVASSDGVPTEDDLSVTQTSVVQDPDRDPFEEDLEEAGFYYSQGLEDEASRIYRSIIERDPDNIKARQALDSIQGESGAPQPAEPEVPVETALGSTFHPPATREVKGKLIVEDSTPEDIGGFLDIADELRAELADEFDKGADQGADGPISFEEIFSQFKKGIEETLGDKEYETHYNLGIAYKDMGLYDDAIRELEYAAKDSSLVQDSLSLMAMCYMEKREYGSAAEAIEQALEIASEDNRTGLYYQLGEVKEKQNDWSEALNAYEQVQSRDPSFAGIAEIIERVKSTTAEGALGIQPEDQPEGGGMEDMLSDLIREVEEMAQETADEAMGDTDKSKKDKISYL